MRKRLTDNPEMMRIAGSGGGGVRREIPDDFKYNPKKLKHLKHILHNVTVALGTLTSCLSEMSKVKGPDVSPDGLLGGKGFIMPLKDMKETIYNTVHNLGNVADSIADELENPKWNIKDKEVDELIKEKEEVEEKVEEVQEDMEAPDNDPSVEDDDINPEELVTAEEYISEKAEKMLKKAVTKDLVNFFHVNKGDRKC